MTCAVYAFQAQRAIRRFVVGSCMTSEVFIIAILSRYSHWANIDRTPALTGGELIK
jgi:hypothetical protein